MAQTEDDIKREAGARVYQQLQHHEKHQTGSKSTGFNCRMLPGDLGDLRGLLDPRRSILLAGWAHGRRCASPALGLSLRPCLAPPDTLNRLA